MVGMIKYVITIFGIVLVHEMGHFLVARIFHRKVISVEILPFGGLLKMDTPISEDILEDLLISIAGIGAQLILGLAFYLFWHFGFLETEVYKSIKYYNVIIIAFNILPLKPLDGSKMFSLLGELFAPYRIMLFATVLISTFGIIFVAIKDISIVRGNFIVFLFIALTTYREYRNIPFLVNRFYLERANKTFFFPKRAYINRREEMYKNRYNFIKGEPERIYLQRFFRFWRK